MGLASVLWWAALLAPSSMACVVTDKIDFEVVPPNLTLNSPPAVSQRPSVTDPECADGMYFTARFFNAQQNDKLVGRVFVNHVLKDGVEILGPDTTGTTQFCVNFSDLGGNGPTPQADCYEVELYVSHAFVPYSNLDPAEPVVEGDVDSVAWYVGVPSPPEAEVPVNLFNACAARGLDPLAPTGALDGGTN